MMRINELRKSSFLHAAIYFFFTILMVTGIRNMNAQVLENNSDVFSKSNLAAWCIVPYDAMNRGPEDRAKMLHEIGITKLAYDWRTKHIPTFDQELAALNKYNVKLAAFWMTTDHDPDNDERIQKVFDFLERNKVKTQIWLSMKDLGEVFELLDHKAKVEYTAKPISNIAKRAAKLGCKVGLYNHGGWFGEPENIISIIDYMKLPNVGMVYNFHHARLHHERFPEFFPKIKPYLYSLNLAGLKKGDTVNFFRVGQGNVEAEMIKLVWESGYNGPIGIINHDKNEDAKKGLLDEMEGLKKILKEIGDENALRTYE